MAPVGPSAPVAAIAPIAPIAGIGQSGSASSSSGRGFSYHYGYDDEQRFVIVSGKTDSLTMSGSGEDARHVEKLRKQISGDFSWKLPPGFPVQVYLRLRVRDKAGNESVAVSRAPEYLDLTEPEGALVGVQAK